MISLMITIWFNFAINPALKVYVSLTYPANTYTSQILENKRDKSDTILCLAIVNIDLSVLSL